MIDFTTTTGLRVRLIGDPHMGRKFGLDQGVPRHRLGERETRQASQLVQELEADADVVITVGDLFDQAYVTDNVVISTAGIVLSAAERNPDVMYFHMAGNHDLPKTMTTLGSWVAFTKMVEDRFPNLKVITKPLIWKTLALFPWEYGRTSKEQVDDLQPLPLEAVVGHWDLSVFDGKDDHLAPVCEIVRAFGENVEIYSGHYHKPGPYTVKGITVHCTGSMQPYTHAEDPEQNLYVTMKLADLLADPASVKHKYVRVLVEPGEEIPEIDCMGLTHIRASKTTSRPTVSLADFDWQKILRERIAPLAEPVQSFIKARVHVDEHLGDVVEADRPGPSDGSSSEDRTEQVSRV